MKAIRVHEAGGPEVLKFEEVPDLTPGDDEVVVRVHAIGVNPVDTYIRNGTYAVKMPYPYTPGSDAAGVVQAVGANVEQLKEGDRVYIGGTKSGAYAEQALCDASQVYPLPDNLSFSQGAAIHVPYATAYRALFLRGKAKTGETLLVHGATGGVGIAAVQLAVSQGLKVFGTGGTAEGRQLVKEQGAAEVFDHHAPDYLDTIKTRTDGKGIDIILEMLANVNLAKDLGLLARNGRVVVIGSRGKVEIDARDTMSRDAAILGMTLLNASTAELHSIHTALGEGFRAGSLVPIVGEEIPLAEAARAHREIMEGGAQGKMVLVT